MKLFLVLIALLAQVLPAGAKPPKCFNNVAGYCRKKCKLGEISEVGCLHGKLCCVNEQRNEEEKQKHLKIQRPPPQPEQKHEAVSDYIVYPTVTLVSIL